MERVIKLQNNTKQTFSLLKAGISPPTDHLKSVLTAFEEFLAQYIENPSGKLILGAITKMAEDIKKRDKEIEDKFKIIGSLPALSTHLYHPPTEAERRSPRESP